LNAPQNSAPRRWFVTGAAGFIGCNVSRSLMLRGDSVVGFDNFFSGERANIERLAAEFGPRFSFIEGDIVDAGALDAALAGCSAVVHLAGQVSVPRSIDFPEETHAVNVTGFMNVFRAAARAGAAHFIYASSCSIYGDNPALPLAEDAVPRPMSPYAASKLANEVYAAGFRVLAPQMTTVGLRFFNIFGPWQSVTGGYAAVIPRWIGLLRDGKRPVVYGDGSATRDFCHVDNVCAAIMRASGLPGGSQALVNVATGVSTRLDELYAIICRTLQDAGLVQACPALQQADPRPGDILHSVGDPARASRDLGFSAAIDLETGLRTMLAGQYRTPAAAAAVR
jgi:UDP-N-acetylglucosamine 4-epimerase